MYAQELYGEYEKKVYVSSQGDSLKYRLLRPEAEKAGKKYPLVLFLHGAGERGDDNQKQLVHGGQMWLNPVNREEYPAFVLAPQCPKEDYWAYVGRPKSFVPGEMPEVQEPTRIFRTLKELLDTYLAMPQVDKDRIYVMGLSMGGMGTFDLAIRYPEVFAAAVPICGIVNPDVYKRQTPSRVTGKPLLPSSPTCKTLTFFLMMTAVLTCSGALPTSGPFAA